MNWFIYDDAGHVKTDSLEMYKPGEPVVDPIVTKFCAAESRGLAACHKAVDVTQIYTLLDGPRPDADTLDLTKFSMDRWGAPTQIVNALGNALTYRDPLSGEAIGVAQAIALAGENIADAIENLAKAIKYHADKRSYVP